jgi:oxalate decarboxylase/phosphoglucose isomerase-like protein (cupin superfamily)
MKIENVKLVTLPKILDPRGNLSFFENNNQIPFDIKRTYWIYDVPGGEIRGSHAFKESHEFIIALSGSFDVILNDGENEMKYSLNRSYYGLYVPNLLWRSIENFSTNSCALIVSSIPYDVSDYIRNFEEFKLVRHEVK